MKYILLAVLALSLSHIALAQDAMSVRTTQPMIIDGRAYEWPAFFRFYAPGTKFQFDILNDDANLYLCVRATEIESQARLMHSGLTIWLDPAGKKKQKSGLSFPMKLDHAPGENPMEPPLMARNADPGSMPSLHSRANKIRERVILSQVSVKSIGLPGIPDGTLPLTNANGLNVAYAWDSLDILYVEYQIPLSLVYGHPVTAADLSHPVGFGLVSGAVDGEHHAGGNGGASGMGNQGMGGGNSRGMGGRPGGMTGQGQTMSGVAYDPNKAEQKTWLKLHLETGK